MRGAAVSFPRARRIKRSTEKARPESANIIQNETMRRKKSPLCRSATLRW
jgi:hypothetical protein